jgi:hypothetical protein
MMNFIDEIYENKGVITKEQSSFYQFYLLVWHLRDNGVLVQNGIDNSNKKIWKFTEDGSKIADHVHEIKKIIGEINERKSNIKRN